MPINATDNLTNSAQRALSYMCSLSGVFAWQQKLLTPKTFIMFVFAAFAEALACPFTILLNALVIWAVQRKRYLRKKKPCLLLACMAATDLLVGVVNQPLEITSHVLRVLGMGPICLIDKIALEISFLITGASLLHLVLISGERYIAIKHALRYETLVTTRRLTIAVAAAWAVPVIKGLVSLAFELAGEIELGHEVINVASLVIFPSSVIGVAVCQVAVFLESRRHRKRIQTHQVSECIAEELPKKDKAARTTTILVGALCLCFAPQMVFYGAVNLKMIPSSYAVSGRHLVNVVLYWNSLMNPIIYCVRTQEFRRAFRELFCLGGSKINSEFAQRNASTTSRHRKNNKVVLDHSYQKKQMAWPDPTSARGSRSRSLDFSKDSTHEQITRRTNSV